MLLLYGNLGHFTGHGPDEFLFQNDGFLFTLDGLQYKLAFALGLAHTAVNREGLAEGCVLGNGIADIALGLDICSG